MAELTKEQHESFEYIMQERIYHSNAVSAFEIFKCYVKGEYGFPKDTEKAFEYLKISSDLCYPPALYVIRALYQGKEVFGIKGKKDLRKYVDALERLSAADSIYDYSALDEEQKNRFCKLQWEAMAELGKQYIIEPELYNEDNYKGYCLSLCAAINAGLPEAYFSLGFYYDCYRPPNYAVSNSLLKKRGNLGTALYYYEMAINSDDEEYSNLAMVAYNKLAQEINERECRTEESMIPYYTR
ncbi:MAG: hypothetical protein PUA84_07535 [Oscillospiraceae bacterium]|nr:hypothetical protein [Oscillospiraceae bacterium]